MSDNTPLITPFADSLSTFTPSSPPTRYDVKGNARKPKIFEVRDDFLAYSPLASKLLYHSGQKIFYHYLNLHYVPLTEDDMFTIIDTFLVDSYQTLFDVTTTNVTEVYKSLTRLASSPLQEFRKVPHTFTPCYSSFDDGVFDFTNPQSNFLITHSATIPSFHRFEFPLPSSKDPTPAFDAYLSSTYVFEDGSPDRELADFMLSVLAYYISPIKPPNPIAVILTGSGSNGKSVFLDLLRCLVGSHFTASVTMENLSSRFGPAALVGKVLNIVSEDQSKYIDTGKIKALISQEYISLERKFEDPGTFRPTAKHIFSTNHDIKFKEIDFATTRRLAVIPHHRTFVSHDSPTIDNQLVIAGIPDLISPSHHDPSVFHGLLVDELPGIVAKLIDRIRLLCLNDYSMPFPPSVRLVQKEIEAASTSSLDFFHQHYIYDPTYTEVISTEEVFNKYEVWYEDEHNDPKFKLNSRSFWSAITKNFPATRTDKKVYSTLFNKTTAGKKGIKPKDL